MVWTMSIALERNNSDSIQRPKFMQCVSVYESPETKGLTGDRRFPVRLERKSEEDSSSSSSIGKNSDDSGGSSDGEDSNEAQSSYKGPLDTLDALDEVLPIKRGISNFYNGKSKSFTSLSDASTASSIKDLVKLENPYTRKRKNLLAHNNFFDKNQNYHFKSNGNGTQKRATNSNRSALVGVTMKSSEFIHSEDSNSISSSHSNHLPPLHPQCKRSPGNGTSLPPPQRNAPWRSFSFSDLQCVAAASPNITGLAIRGGDVDNKYY